MITYMGWKDVASWLLIRQLFKKKIFLSAELWITRESRVYEDFPLTDYTNLGIKKSLLYICIADGPSGLKSAKRSNLWKPNCLPQKTIITNFFQNLLEQSRCTWGSYRHLHFFLFKTLCNTAYVLRFGLLWVSGQTQNIY